MITTYTWQHAWFQYCTHFKIYTRTGQTTHKMILHSMSLNTTYFQMKPTFSCCFVVVVFFFFLVTLDIISHFLLSSKYTHRWKMSETIFLSLCPFKCKLHAYLFNLYTENSAIAYDKYNILISNTEEMEFPHNSILNVFQTNRIRICHLLHIP